MASTSILAGSLLLSVLAATTLPPASAMPIAAPEIPGAPPTTARVAPPNILFLFLDDLRWDAVGFTGNSVITTPHIDDLAAEGTVFEHAFTTTAVCGPSRACVFSGQHMARHGVTTVQRGTFTSAKWAKCYPGVLDAAGYYLGFIGKHGHRSGFTGIYRTFDFDKGYDGQGSYFNQTIQGESAGTRHLTRFLGDLAVQFVKDSGDPKRNTNAAPFCLQISFKSPHVQDSSSNPFQPDPAYRNLYSADTIPHAKTDTQAQFDALPSFFRASSAAGTSRWRGRFASETAHQDNIKKHHRLIHGVDVQIGRILAALHDPNGDGKHDDSVRDNTVIILGSDHGFFLGERHQAGKWYIQEESIRVPLLIFDPRLAAGLRGKRVSPMVLNIDIPATILDYAGVAKPPIMQGRSLVSIVEGKIPGDWRTAFLHDHPGIGGIVFKNEGVRTESFSYTRYPSNGNVKQLYDVTVDPYQRTNLAADPRYAAKLSELDTLTNLLKAGAK